MNIDEGKNALEIANKVHPIKKWKEVLYIGVTEKTFGVWKGDYFLHYISNHRKKFQCTIVEK